LATHWAYEDENAGGKTKLRMLSEDESDEIVAVAEER
jgi:hypothetical protein